MRSGSYGSYYYGGTRRESESAEEPLGPRKTLLVVVVVVGCFAVLWPKVFYPMLVNSANKQIKPSPADKTTGCCDVISDLDLDTIKIMSELCSTIIESKAAAKGAGSQDLVAQCRKAVLETCGIDISAVLQERVSLGHSTRQILEEARSLNGSLCLKYNFGVSPWSLGVSHRIHLNVDPASTIRQERPSHLRPEMVHPAFKERGRAIPQPESTTRRPGPPPKIVQGRPGPIPGMRPAMGGPGHVVPPSKQANNGFLGVLMPVYTIGFVVFFTYTIMKLVFKKKPEEYAGSSLYPQVDTDDQFHKEVFEDNRNYYHRPSRDSSKIGWKERDAIVNAVSALLEEVNQELEARKQKTAADAVTEQDGDRVNGEVFKEEEAGIQSETNEKEGEEKEEQGSVTVMGMETTASCEGGKKWSRPDSPVLPHPPQAPPKEPSPPPQQIFLEGSLPPQSQLLVSDSATETQKEPEDDAPIVLAGKMTLSVISLDSETGTEDSSASGKKAESPEADRRSSGNTSDEFEKINASDLEDQINSIIEEAEIIAMNDEKRLTLSEELDKLEEQEAPRIDVLEEIKNQLNLEDDLIRAIAGKDPEPVKLPVTDLIKEFLSEEENALLAESIGIGNIEKEVADALKEDNDQTKDELLSDEEREIIAKYQAIEEEEKDQEPTAEHVYSDEQQKLEELLPPPDELPTTNSTQFIRNEEQALLNEKYKPVTESQINQDNVPAETESSVQVPLETSAQEQETVETPQEAVYISPNTSLDQVSAPSPPLDEDPKPAEAESAPSGVEVAPQKEETAKSSKETVNIPPVAFKDQVSVPAAEEHESAPSQVEIPLETAPVKEEISEAPVTSEDQVSVPSPPLEEDPRPVEIESAPSPAGISLKTNPEREEIVEASVLSENQFNLPSQPPEEDPRPVETESAPSSAKVPLEPVPKEKVNLPPVTSQDQISAPTSPEEYTPVETESAPTPLEIPLEVIPRGEETSEDSKDSLYVSPETNEELKPIVEEILKQYATPDESIKVVQDVPVSKDKSVESATSPDKNYSENDELTIDGIKEDPLLQEELLESGDQDEAHKLVVREADAGPGSDTQQKVISSGENQPETEILTGKQNTEEQPKELEQDTSADQGLPLETENDERKQSQTSSIEPITSESQSVDEMDIIEQVIEDIEYQDESDSEELPRSGRNSAEAAEERLNGVENEDSENELDDDDVEIEEVIEYVDNTDEEGEEIIEINGNQQERNVQNHN
ncbi:hypothetical protein GWI33_013611 [Rhynchophorus ferrugineus]|uniref:Resistance to inhibitors of cholinesterase protein 3 N-terminal domain-containing protein n=1 Tax=Rhynchophorus ferrugineus TaxID=354439 RepID=A0A834I636_RHYFE|nr:hypothetical protein GWI33_013611 [Rhynchophorus ferrugineus]